jgi:hypothetical protein
MPPQPSPPSRPVLVHSWNRPRAKRPIAQPGRFKQRNTTQPSAKTETGKKEKKRKNTKGKRSTHSSITSVNMLISSSPTPTVASHRLRSSCSHYCNIFSAANLPQLPAGIRVLLCTETIARWVAKVYTGFSIKTLRLLLHGWKKSLSSEKFPRT